MPEMKLTSEQTINGAFGVLQIGNLVTRSTANEDKQSDVITLANVQSVDARVNVERRDFKLAGSRATVYKAMGVNGEGSFTIFRVSSEFINLGVDAMKPGNNFNTLGGRNPINNISQQGLSLMVSQRDPEILRGMDEDIILGGVKIWEIPFGFSVDDLVTQTITFTFETMQMVSSHIIEPL